MNYGPETALLSVVPSVKSLKDEDEFGIISLSDVDDDAID